MSEMVDLISSEFEEALEVKNSKSLHRGIFLLLSSTVPKAEHSLEHNDLKSSINALNHNVELLALRMTEGFEKMERHFDKRFAMMFSFITIGFVILATMMSVFQFLG